MQQTVFLIAALLVGFVAGWVLARRGGAAHDGASRRLERELADANMQIARLETVVEKDREAAEQREALLAQQREQLAESFQALSSEALRKNNEAFLGLATTKLETMHAQAKGDLEKRQQAIDASIKPVRESLDKVDIHLRKIENERVGAYSKLTTQMEAMLASEQQLRTETGRLVTALRSPVARGQWGEMQLKRVVELAGMQSHCDFVEQVSVDSEHGRQRPDLLVQLAGGRSIVVDAKVPLSAYLEALEAEDEAVRTDRLRQHARQLRDHVMALSRKSYWEQFDPTPEMVVLFVPAESLLYAALEQDPSLYEDAARYKVSIATPHTLIATLRTMALGWKEEALAENARHISDLGRELYQRVGKLADHWGKVGTHLQRAVSSYNSSVSSLESRVLVTARRFKDLEVAPADSEIERLPIVEILPRSMDSDELTESEYALAQRDGGL